MAELGLASDVLRRLAGKYVPITLATVICVSGFGVSSIASANGVTSRNATSGKTAASAAQKRTVRQFALAVGASRIPVSTAGAPSGKALAEANLQPLLYGNRTPYKAGVVTDSFVDKTIGVESGGKADAKNPNSSALGQGQFIKSTWLRLVDAHKPSWAEGLDEVGILEKRKEPDASRWAIRLYAEQNMSVLQRAGIAVSHAALYLSHMLDGPVAAKLYKARPNTSVKSIVGVAAFQANKTLMKGKKAKELIAWAERKMGERHPVAGAKGSRQS
jgi:hypothetical protein